MARFSTDPKIRVPREPTLHNYGLYAVHDHRCAVLRGKFAVVDCQTEIYHPSRDAQALGWRLVRADTALRRFLLRHFFGATP